MTSATLRRGNSRARPKKKARAKKPPLFSRLIGKLPLPFDTLQHFAGYGVVALGLALAATAATLLGVPQMIGLAAADMAGRAGFTLERIELTGVDRVERKAVYAIAAEHNGAPMPLVDLTAIRRDVMALGWIGEARVSLRLPNTLLIDVIERKPAAIWQNAGALTLIDGEGVALEPVALDAMPDLPLVIGPDANKQVPGLARLVESAPALKPMLAGASWVGKRRWDLRFQSGETLALPEGEREATTALTKFAALDQRERLLGRGFKRFDMRVAGKFYVRLPEGGRRIDDLEGEGNGATAL